MCEIVEKATSGVWKCRGKRTAEREHEHIGSTDAERQGALTERHIAHALAAVEPRDGADLQRRLAVAVQHLRRILDRRLAPCIDEFL
jgi:hypothetical protein